MAVKIDKSRCIGCGLCVQTCPFEALALNQDGIVMVDEGKCTECGACPEVCPSDALNLPHPPPELSRGDAERVEAIKEKVQEIVREPLEYNGVWVFIEQIGSQAAPVSWELIGEGRKLAEKLDTELAGVLLGSGVETIAGEAFAFGADKIYLIDDPVLADYRTEPYTQGIVQLIEKYRPEIMLMGATSLGRDLSGAVATRLGTGLTADCTELDIAQGTRFLEQTRPAFGGNIMATILCRHHRPQMATVRPRVMPMPSRQGGRSGEVIRADLGLAEDNIITKVLNFTREAGSAVYLDKAEIIVAGGRGVGGPKGFASLKEMADVLGGTLGASRAAVEAGWMSVDYQVGQTGKTVRPKVYFAVGISGAIQHLVGMQTADVIVAINSNPEAPIFKVATFGITGDFNQVIPELTAAFREKLHG